MWIAHPPPCLPTRLRRWLADRGSLTRRLRALGGQFSVQVGFEGVASLRPDEARLFGLRPGQRVRLREVLLLIDNQPMVAARSFWPQARLPAAWQRLARLGNRPLGDALFTNPAVVRHALQFRREPTPTGTGLARRSVFTCGRSGMVVSETFLPALQARLQHPARLPARPRRHQPWI